MSVSLLIGHVPAAVSTILTNVACLREHDAAVELLILSMRRPLQSAGILGARRHRRALPATDERFADADSLALHGDVVALLGACEIVHVDATLLIERPKRAPYKEAIHYAPLGALGVAPDRVNVKASNGEG